MPDVSAYSLRGNLSSAPAPEQDVAMSSIAASGNPIGDAIKARVPGLLLSTGTPQFTEKNGVLGRGIIFDKSGSADVQGTFVMPANKQFDYMGWRDIIQQTQGSKISWLDFDLIINGGQADTSTTPGSNAYAMIGDLTNNGPGTVASFYGRATIGTDNTAGNGIAYKGGVTTRKGAGTTAGFQMSVDTLDRGDPTAVPPRKPKGVDYGFYLQCNNYGGLGYTPLDYGFLAFKEVHIEQALLQGFAGGSGDCLRWLNADGSANLAVIDKLGNASFQGMDIAYGTQVRATYVALPSQGIVKMPNGNREFQLQAVTAGDHLRVIVGNVGDSLTLDAALNLGVGGQTSAGGAMRAVLLPNSSPPTSGPASGGILYVQNGNLMYMGPSGSPRIVAAA